MKEPGGHEGKRRAHKALGETFGSASLSASPQAGTTSEVREKWALNVSKFPSSMRVNNCNL